MSSLVQSSRLHGIAKDQGTGYQPSERLFRSTSSFASSDRWCSHLVIDGPLRDGSRVGLGPFGPFRNHDDFHHFLRADTPLDSIGALEGGQEIVKAHRQQYRTTFTHGDFAPRN